MSIEKAKRLRDMIDRDIKSDEEEIREMQEYLEVKRNQLYMVSMDLEIDTRCNEPEIVELEALTGKGPEHWEVRESLVKSLIEKGWQVNKFNIPDCGINYINGNGEGILVLMSPEDDKDYNADRNNGFFKAVTLNMSSYYPGDIGFGYVVEGEFRGVKRGTMRWEDSNPYMPWFDFDASVSRFDRTSSREVVERRFNITDNPSFYVLEAFKIFEGYVSLLEEDTNYHVERRFPESEGRCYLGGQCEPKLQDRA